MFKICNWLTLSFGLNIKSKDFSVISTPPCSHFVTVPVNLREIWIASSADSAAVKTVEE